MLMLQNNSKWSFFFLVKKVSWKITVNLRLSRATSEVKMNFSFINELAVWIEITSKFFSHFLILERIHKLEMIHNDSSHATFYF